MSWYQYKTFDISVAGIVTNNNRKLKTLLSHLLKRNPSLSRFNLIIVYMGHIHIYNVKANIHNAQVFKYQHSFENAEFIKIEINHLTMIR